MAARKENVKLIVAIIVVFLAVISYRAYRDMNPPTEPVNVETAPVPSYLARTDKALAAVPIDQVTSVLVDAGEITAGKDGLPVLTLKGPQPKTFAQVDLIPVVTIRGLPKNFALGYQKVDAALLPWRKVGSLINDVLINFTGDTPDYDDIRAFCNGLKGNFGQDTFIDVQLKLPAGEITPATRNKLADILKSTKLFVFEDTDVAHKGETPTDTIARLKKEELPFLFLTGQQVDLTKIGKLMEQKGSFAGIILDPLQVKPATATAP